MTERKTTEIKFRVTPRFKARVQGAADAAGVSLTEWLETSALERMVGFSIGTPIVPVRDVEHPARSWMYEGKGG